LRGGGVKAYVRDICGIGGYLRVGSGCGNAKEILGEKKDIQAEGFTTDGVEVRKCVQAVVVELDTIFTGLEQLITQPCLHVRILRQ